MGGHGGLNILPQKKWNVYNFDNREKVRKDEEAAAGEEQLKRDQSRRRDAEFRVERLRHARGLSNFSPSPSSSSKSSIAVADSHHFNLFDGLKDLSSIAEEGNRRGVDLPEDARSKNGKKRRREDAPLKPPPEDEKYKLGYGLIGKGVEAPWYTSKPSFLLTGDGKKRLEAGMDGSERKSNVRKTIDELREERIRRERQENERERLILASMEKKGGNREFSRMRK